VEQDSGDSDARKSGVEKDLEIAPALKPDASNPGVGDPFDPRAWEKVKAEPPKAAGDPARPETPATREVNTGGSGEQSSASADPAEVEISADKNAEPPPGTAADSGKKVEERQAQRESEAAAIAREIVSQLGADEDSLKQAFTVMPTADGILISLTERENFEMFQTGSAEPRAETMKVVEAIAAAVQSRRGRLVIRGHTDSRPYRNKYYDNWQLSTARAHFARYMLIRSGVDETRIWRIEGVADREPRNTEDPQAAENRRIDILIESGSP
jgi:chemotaxis protein MotB